MKPRHLFLAVLLVMVATGIFWGLSHERTGSASPVGMHMPDVRQWFRYWTVAADAELRQREYLALFRQSLDLHGVVLEDLTHAPIADAEVSLEPISNPGMASRQPEATMRRTDAQGRFAFTGHKGNSLFVQVSKAGYYAIEHRSDAVLVHGAGNAESHWTDFPKDPEQPVYFYLRQQGNPAAYLVSHDLDKRVPRDGTPYGLSLTHGTGVRAGQTGDIQVECTSNDQQTVGHPFDWHCRITVPGGGLQPRTDPFAFQAPETGYAEGEEFDMPKTLARDKWQSTVRREYFFHLANGSYARGMFEMIPDGNHFFHLAYYFNAVPGDRNLEADKMRPGENVIKP